MPVVCVVCNVSIVEKHDFNLIRGKNNCDEEIFTIFNLYLPGIARNLLSSHKYICKQCLRLLKKRTNLKANLEIVENEFLSRIRHLTDNLNASVYKKTSDKDEEDDRPNIQSTSMASESGIQSNVTTGAEKVVDFLHSATPLKRTVFADSTVLSCCSTPITQPKKVIIIESGKKTSHKGKSAAIPSSSNCGQKISTSVNIKVTWTSGTRQRDLPKDLISIGTMLCRGTYKQIANAVMKNQSIRSEVIKLVMKDIDRECTKLCRKGSSKHAIKTSILQKTSPEDMLNFSFQSLWNELKETAPLLLNALNVASIRPKKKLKTEDTIYSACMAAAVCLKNRSPKMTAVQLLITMIIQHSGMMVRIKKHCPFLFNII